MLPSTMTDAHVITPEVNSQKRLFGTVIVLMSAASFGLMLTIASLSYEGGANPITFAIARIMAITLFMIPLVFLLQRGWSIPRKAFVPVGLTVIGNVGLGVGILSAVQFIPVALAILIMYIYPALVLIIETLVNRQKFSPLHLFICALAFSGLALVLGPSIGNLDWRGIAFASVACVSITLLMLATHRARRDVNEITLLFWTNSCGLPLMLLLMPLLGGLSLPTTQVSWTSLVAGCLLFIFGFWGYALSMRFISASKASMIYNIEPIVAIISAAIILGESLVLLQLLGATLVIFSVFLATRSERFF
jgi:drug/metabolite transporter (DMT)-like permease